MMTTMQGFVEYSMYVSQGGIQMSTEGILVINGYIASDDDFGLFHNFTSGKTRHYVLDNLLC